MKNKSDAVHVAINERTRKGKLYRTVLLRTSFRQDGKVKHKTLGNLSHLPDDVIATIQQSLAAKRAAGRAAGRPRGGAAGGGDNSQKSAPTGGDNSHSAAPAGSANSHGAAPDSDNSHSSALGAADLKILRSLPHGHVEAVLGMLRRLGLERMLDAKPSRRRDLAVAMIAQRLLEPQSKLASARGWRAGSAATTLAEELGLSAQVRAKDLYAALDWLLARQPRVEKALAAKHLREGVLVLYDVTSSYYTGQVGGLVQYGYNRDGKDRYPQIVIGLLCDREGRPVAVETFPGNTADPNTIVVQIQKLRARFDLKRVVLVGDRGMLTSKRIDEELRGIDGLDWISALRADQIKQLAAAGTIQPSLFDDVDHAEVQSPDYPGERLVVCKNPLLADKRKHVREELLTAAERDLEKIAAATRRARNPLRGKGNIGVRVGKIIDKRKVGKHFEYKIEDDSFSYQRKEEQIKAEAALDGLYVVRTSVAKADLETGPTVAAYKQLSHVERAFRSLKTIDLHIRPIRHRLDERIKAHVFLCMLSYYSEWHLCKAWAPALFVDHHRAAAEAERTSPVAPAPRSAAARKKDRTQKAAAGAPVHSLRTLLLDLGTICRNRVRLGTAEFDVVTTPTPGQHRLQELLLAPAA